MNIVEVGIKLEKNIDYYDNLLEENDFINDFNCVAHDIYYTNKKLDGLTEFYPERMANRILDMGDILSIAEKANNAISEADAKDLAKKMRKGDYDLEDFLTNLKQIRKLGPLENILKMKMAKWL